LCAQGFGMVTCDVDVAVYGEPFLIVGSVWVSPRRKCQIRKVMAERVGFELARL